MGNQHSLGYPHPVLQKTARAPLPSINTHHPALHIGQEAGVPHQQAPIYAPDIAGGHWAHLHHAGRTYPRPSCQEFHGQPLYLVPPGHQILAYPVCQNDNLPDIPCQDFPPGCIRHRLNCHLQRPKRRYVRTPEAHTRTCEAMLA